MYILDDKCFNQILKFNLSSFPNHCDPGTITWHVPFGLASLSVSVVELYCIFFPPGPFAAPTNASLNLAVVIGDPPTSAAFKFLVRLLTSEHET